MKKIALLLMFATLQLSCSSSDDGNEPLNDVPVHFVFTQNWDGAPIENSDYETTSYFNAHGEEIKLSKLDYLISDMTFTNANGEVFTAGDFNLISAKTGTNQHFVPNVEIPEGTYTISFTFGFNDEDNSGNYPTLNSANWNVPLMLGGGYHYMRMEGTFINSQTDPLPVNFQYHTIRAVDRDELGTITTLTDTSFEVNLGEVTITDDLEIEIKMNVAEWFKNPNTWDLTQLYTLLMPNYDAQIMMSENGQNGVFSLGEVGPHDD